MICLGRAVKAGVWKSEGYYELQSSALTEDTAYSNICFLRTLKNSTDQSSKYLPSNRWVSTIKLLPSSDEGELYSFLWI